MRSVWKTTYDENEIEIENTWFQGERLYVNGKLQDERQNFFSADLSGHLINKNNNKENIKVNMSGWVKINCRLFINDQKVEVKQIQ